LKAHDPIVTEARKLASMMVSIAPKLMNIMATGGNLEGERYRRNTARKYI
jgi:hypothetical protein